MKKTVKLILVVTVIAILSLMATSAYAYEIGDQIKWQDENKRDAFYAGEITEGLNEVPESDTGRVFKFEAQKTGYYFITESIGPSFLKEFENNKIVGHAEMDGMIDENNNHGSIVYLEKGTHYALLWCEFGAAFRIEYFGTVENIIYDEENSFVLGEDAYLSDEKNEIYVSGYDITVEFSNGRKLTRVYGSDVSLMLIDELKNGENKVVYNFIGGYEETITVGIYEITKVIKSVELSNIGRYTTIYKDYNGYYNDIDIGEETLTVKFTDGTEYVAMVEQNGVAQVVLPFGKTVTAYIGYKHENTFCVTISYEVFLSVECEVEGMMLGDNLNVLRENNMESLRWSMNLLKDAFENLGEDPEVAGMLLRWSAEEFVQVFRNITRFVTYYLTIAY